jgi:hypothetical protein
MIKNYNCYECGNRIEEVKKCKTCNVKCCPLHLNICENCKGITCMKDECVKRVMWFTWDDSQSVWFCRACLNKSETKGLNLPNKMCYCCVNEAMSFTKCKSCDCNICVVHSYVCTYCEQFTCTKDTCGTKEGFLVWRCKNCKKK